jgi:uncharacterized protein (DUF1697 family)
MPTFVALLRGINVGGNALKMERLRQLCAELGAENISTYVQSGNVVFQAKQSSSHWRRLLEKRLLGECRLPVSVMVRTANEMSLILDGNPFLKEKGIDIARLAVTFLQQTPTRDALAALGAMKLGSERFHFSGNGAGKEIYLHCPNGFADAKLYTLDRVLSQKTTVRNWNTVTKLTEMSSK